VMHDPDDGAEKLVSIAMQSVLDSKELKKWPV